MARERLDPPYRAYAVAADGSQVLIEALGIVVEVGPGLFIDMDLAPHPNFKGGLPMFAGRRDQRDSSLASTFYIHPGAGNVIHVYVRSSSIEVIGESPI